MAETTNTHPIREAWVRYQRTTTYKVHLLIHSEAALYEGFRDGWLAGRERRDEIGDNNP